MRPVQSQTETVFGTTSNKNVWHIIWHTGPYSIAAETYGHLLPVADDDLHLVKDIYENHEDTDPAYITTYFQKKTNGECFPKTYVFHCEF